MMHGPTNIKIQYHCLPLQKTEGPFVYRSGLWWVCMPMCVCTLTHMLAETFPQPTVESSMIIFFSMHIIFGIAIPYGVTPCINIPCTTFIFKKPAEMP